MKKITLMLLICMTLVLSACNVNIPVGDVTTPEATTPEATTPEVSTPEVTLPEVTLPEEITPEATTPEVTLPEDPSNNSDYEMWVAYFDAVVEYEASMRSYTKYVEYQNDYTAAIETLAMFESVFKKDSHGWCLYKDIRGSTVTEVLSKQDLLVTSGCNPDDIYLAGQATENLRVLLKGYNNLRNKKWSSDHDKYQALYAYYTENYEALTQNFCDLYKSLKGLYKNTVVSSFIGVKGKTEHYRQLVGHLFVVSTAFDTSVARDESTWRVGKKTLAEVIDMDVHYFEDGDQWYPTVVYPENEVPFAEHPGEYPERPSVPCPMIP